MGAELRRFPRIPYTESGQLQIPVKIADPDAGTVTVPVVVRTVSCQGAGLDVGRDTAARLTPGTEVLLAMQVHDRELELPGRIVWAAGNHAGIRLHLGKADDDVRQAYASWIVPLTNKAIARARS